MNDDLIARLRSDDPDVWPEAEEAADALEAKDRRIAELEKMLAVHRLAVDVDALKARIAELTAALREFNFYLILDSDKDTDTLPVLIGHIRAARAAYLGEKE
jgi:hypothetical protein